MTDHTPVPLTIPRHLSHSQKSSLTDYCPGKYYLERLIRVPSKPSWAATAGGAVHETTEWIDSVLLTGEIPDDPQIGLKFTERFEQGIADRTERTGFGPEDFWAGGRRSKQWPDKENKDFWLSEGPAQCRRWLNWRCNTPWGIAMLPATDGRKGDIPGIEYEMAWQVGGIDVRAYIDRVFEWQDTLIVLDLKTGSRVPDSASQLATYRHGLKTLTGRDAQYGVYWMGRKGATELPTDLSQVWPDARLEYDYRLARERQLRGDFPYKESAMCVSCGVRDYCAAVGGEFAGTVKQPWEQELKPVLDSYDTTSRPAKEIA